MIAPRESDAIVSEDNRIVLERRAGVAWLRIARAEKANALTVEMMASLRARIDEATADDAIRALVVTGAGGRAFCAGVDVRAAVELPDADARELRSERFFALITSLARCPKPVIAALNGIASGGGAMTALLADRVVAADHAAITLPEIDLGGPTLPGAAILTHLAGAGLASDLLQSGRRMPAAEALARGLFHEVVAADTLDAQAQRAAELYGGKPAHAFALNKEWLRRTLVAQLAAAHHEHRKLRAAGVMH